jgi:hypothetical protein
LDAFIPAVNVNDVGAGVVMAVPAFPTKPIVPVHDAAVPFEEFCATFSIVTSRDSLEAMLTGGRLNVRG